MRPILRRSLILVGTLLMLCSGSSFGADSVPATSVLVELFTSEGCSDCPPADALLRQMDAQPVSGAQLIVLEEHVDYWDDQGWKDPFSSHEWTVRQSDYAEHLHVKAPYTPQMIVDGVEQFVGSDTNKAETAIRSALANGAVSVKISGLKTDHGKVLAHVETDAAPSSAKVFAALALEHAETQVARGENGGRKLEHVAILQSLGTVGKLRAGESFAKDISLAEHFGGKPGRLIVFVQEPNQGKVLGAAMEHVEPQP